MFLNQYADASSTREGIDNTARHSSFITKSQYFLTGSAIGGLLTKGDSQERNSNVTQAQRQQTNLAVAGPRYARCRVQRPVEQHSQQ